VADVRGGRYFSSASPCVGSDVFIAMAKKYEITTNFRMHGVS